MPITAQSADGRTHEFPDGTDRTVIDRVMKDYASKGKQFPQSMQHPQDMGVGERLKTGFMDPFVGATQAFKHAGGGDAAGYDQYVQERERDIRQRTEGGFDWARTAGSMANPLNLIPGGAATMASKPLAKLATGAIGGAVGAATEPVTSGDFGVEKGIKVLEGGAAGLGLGVAGNMAGKAIQKSGSGIAELEKSARAGYDALKSSNTVLKGPEFQNVQSIIAGQLKDNQFRDYLSPKTFAVMKEIADHKGDVNMGDLIGWQKLLKKVRGDPEDQAAAGFAQDHLDHYLSNIPPHHIISGNPQQDIAILKKAQADWRAARRSDVVDVAMNKAERQAGKSGSGFNLDNTLRQQIDRILNSKTERARYSPDEIKDMEKIVNGTFVGNAARLIGKLAPTGVVSGAADLAAAAAGGPMAGLATAGVGTAAKITGDQITKGRVRALSEGIRSKAPSYVPPAPPPAWQSAPVSAIPALAPGAGSALAQPDDALGPGQ